jgi:hypothetical protein
MERFRASMWTVVYRVAKFINEDVEEQRDDECRAPCDIPYCRIWCYSVLAYCVLASVAVFVLIGSCRAIYPISR